MRFSENRLNTCNVSRIMPSWSRHFIVIALLAIGSIFLAGCPQGAGPAPSNVAGPATHPPLTLLVVDDPELGKAIAREWRGRTEEDLTVRDVALTDIVAAARLPGDAIVFPCGLIGQLCERGLIVPLDNAALEDSEFNYRDIFDLVRLREIRWGHRTFAVPLGSPQLLLAYRADVFEKAGLEPPADWTSYQKAVVRLADRVQLGDLAPKADQPWRAAAEPLADGWAGQLLLARAAAYAMHRDQVSPLLRFDALAPLVDQPPYLRALEELVAAASAGNFADQRFSPAEAFAELKAGRCAMALGWPASELGAGGSARETPIRFALLPGSEQAYRFATKDWENRGPDESWHVPVLAMSGRMAAVAATSADPRRAEGFVLWLAGREVSQQVSPHSIATTLFRNSQIVTSDRWTGSLSPASSRQYAEVLGKTLSLPRAFPGLTLPGRLDYLTALDQAVQKAVAGQPAGDALSEAAKRWSSITDKLGLDQQRRANARSLGQGD